MRKTTKRILCGLLALLLVGGGWLGVRLAGFDARLTRVEPDSAKGFRWPYYLYDSPGARQRAERGETVHLLVLPNNTGRPDDDFEVHRRAAWLRMLRDRAAADELGVAALVPIFPRPESNWRVYTHALDRDALTTEIGDLARLDMQLIAMIDDARERLASRGWRVGEKVLLRGFSANGMFAIRFAALHPERVLAVAAGSPGGWPIAPVAAWEGKPLRYPVGIADLETLTGKPFDAEGFSRLPIMIFMGDRDDNDSVPFGDGYDPEDRDLVFETFGRTPIERWPASEETYRAAGTRALFRLDLGVGHETSDETERAVREFLRRAMTEAATDSSPSRPRGS